MANNKLQKDQGLKLIPVLKGEENLSKEVYDPNNKRTVYVVNENVSFDREVVLTANEKEVLFDLDEYEKYRNKSLQATDNDFKNILVYNVVVGNNLEYFERLNRCKWNIIKYRRLSISFPDVLVGGGKTYIEAYFENNVPKLSKFHGVYISKTGEPCILNAKWSDKDGIEIKKGEFIKGGSYVFLHIYTKDLYGMELKVKLFCKGKELDNENGNFFKTNEVNIYRYTPVDIGATGKLENCKSGELVTIKSNCPNMIESYVQKAIVRVYIKEHWIPDGDTLKIFPSVSYPDANGTEQEPCKLKNDYICVSNEEETTLLKNEDGKYNGMTIRVGQVEQNIALFRPCGYTQVKAIDSTRGKDIVLYDQDGDRMASTLQIVSDSEAKSVTLKLDEDATTNDCIAVAHLGEKSEHKGRVFELVNFPKGCSPNVVKSDTEITFDAQFIYDDINPTVGEALNPFNFDALKYLWLNNNIESCDYKIDIHSCRLFPKQTFLVRVFPDIKWEFSFLLASDDKYEIRHTNMPAGKRFAEIQEKAIRAGQAKRSDFCAGKLKIGLSLLAKWDSEKHSTEFAGEYINKIAPFVKLFSKVKELTDKIMTFGADKENPEHNLTFLQKQMKYLAKTKKPFILSISYPEIELTGGWQLSYNNEVPNAYTEGSIEFAAQPLIAGEGRLDIVALASYIPIVKAIEAALDFCGITIEAYVEALGDISFALTHVFGSNSSTELKSDNKFGVRFGISIKAKYEIDFIIEADVWLKAEGYAESYFKFGGTIGIDKKGFYFAPILGFDGMKIVLELEAGYNNHIAKKKVDIPILDKFDILKEEKYYI